MGDRPGPNAGSDTARPRWVSEPYSRSPRPWLSALLSLASAALVILGSLGPWLYTEQGPQRAIEVRMVHGVNTDGVFSLFFAGIALLAVLGALARPSMWILGWVAVAAMVMCTLVGLFDWVIFDPMALAAQSTQRPDYVRVEWGLKLLTAAAPIGVAGTVLFTRRLMDGDY